jgi:predicted AAA+ superfamily ATPase
MATSNRDRVGRALDLLTAGLRPYVEREFQARYGTGWEAEAISLLRDDRGGAQYQSELDFSALAGLILGGWNEVFSRVLGPPERSLLFELRSGRNDWAHQKPLSTDNTYRFLDSAERLLLAISAEQAEEVGQQKQELLRQTYELQRLAESRKATTAATQGQPLQGLKPWRELVTPHPDVASGRYLQAEFAADLWQVYRGDASPEYQDPTEFFRRTYLTDGLRQLLVGALRRLTPDSPGGAPVIELQTNFGGGKTHSMLALYHLFSGTLAAALPGLEGVLAEAGALAPGDPRRTWSVQRAVLVGTRISPGQPHRKKDGTVIRTLWGELAYQLAGRDGYELVREADETGTNPGDALRELFETCTPSLILIDEWVAYARQLYGKYDLPGGSFETHFTFAQALTEAAKHVPGTLLVVSVPASEIEIGGQGGETALERLKNAIGRVESPWRPATTEEGFEIIRRRLFEPITREGYRGRDAVVRAFGELYRQQRAEFPAECREAEYERRLAAAYPIHPELFDRLYSDWSTLDKFQRTRGVLRFMAAVIHELWEAQDGGLVILPGSIPVDAAPVQSELTRYLDDPWVPVIERDVDGPHSLPLKLDRENPNLGRYSACRRVARTIYLGSAPTLHTANKGLEDRQIKLGCVQPGESVATFGDSLRRLTDLAAHLYVDGRRYWYSTQPSVTRLAQERAAQEDRETVLEELRGRLKAEASARGDFAGVHACPQSGSDVEDEREARLVILGPEHPHSARNAESEARTAAAALLESRGSGPRLYRNTLVFLAADRARLGELEQAIREFRAWDSIHRERDTLNLDAFQANQARTKRESADETVKSRIREAYQWLLAPSQPGTRSPVEWTETRLQGSDSLAQRAAKRLKSDGALLTQLGPVVLRLELDRVPLWRGEHVNVRQLVDDFAQYHYLPRLLNAEVLLASIREGVSSLTWEQDTFAYAGAWDATTERYLGLQTGRVANISRDSESVIVKSEAALRQLERERREAGTHGPGVEDEPGPGTPGGGAGGGTAEGPRGGPADTGGGSKGEKTPVKPRRFQGAVRLDPVRLGRDAGNIAQEVVAHLTGLVGSEVEITLEIQARVPDGAPDHVVRVVTENCRTLKFDNHGFEES